MLRRRDAVAAPAVRAWREHGDARARPPGSASCDASADLSPRSFTREWRAETRLGALTGIASVSAWALEGTRVGAGRALPAESRAHGGRSVSPCDMGH